ncbi:MAG: LON peptidase substrate-binding domain-containing protein [Chromatiales bacterium]|nr:LON peptidase substrate-binding domain-containing protein [Chromatiales bacterium]
MHRNPFTLPFDRLPADIAVFPLSGAVLMPGTQLPLNVFEPRYLNMVEDALGARRLIGMIQPLDEDERVLSKTGCAGRISSFSETDDGRIILVLTGLCRFDVVDELPLARGYRRVRADWTRFNGDYQDPAENEIDRTGLTDALRAYAESVGAEVSWDGFEKADDHLLVNALIANLPLDNKQKQSLIETVLPNERAELLKAILEMVGGESGGGGRMRH